jgi:hypothetical protein
VLRLAVVKKTKCFEYPYYHFSRFTCKWASIEEGERRGSNPPPSQSHNPLTPVSECCPMLQN